MIPIDVPLPQCHIMTAISAANHDVHALSESGNPFVQSRIIFDNRR